MKRVEWHSGDEEKVLWLLFEEGGVKRMHGRVVKRANGSINIVGRSRGWVSIRGYGI